MPCGFWVFREHKIPYRK